MEKGLLIYKIQVGGGTGYNIEAMSKYISVPDFFSTVYLVDFSPSLCEVARKRFARLGWDNVKLVCQDARLFKLEDHEDLDGVMVAPGSPGRYSNGEKGVGGGADLITMSYSLSMIVWMVPSIEESC
jgi:betaine lipid synthase